MRHRVKTGKRADIGVVFSVNAEGSILIRHMAARAKGAGMFYTGRLAGKDAVLALSGIGKANAAHAATRLITEFSPEVIINIGVGGAYPSSGLSVGDLAIAQKEVYGDEGLLLKDGFHEIDSIGIPLLRKGSKRYFNEFPLNSLLAGKAVRAARLVAHEPSPIKVKKGVFLTVSTCTGTKKRALELERRFSAICENMEGAAIAQICALYGIPLIEMRGISNIVEDRDLSGWNIKLAAENCQRALLGFIKLDIIV